MTVVVWNECGHVTVMKMTECDCVRTVKVDCGYVTVVQVNESDHVTETVMQLDECIRAMGMGVQMNERGHVKDECSHMMIDECGHTSRRNVNSVILQRILVEIVHKNFDSRSPNPFGLVSLVLC